MQNAEVARHRISSVLRNASAWRPALPRAEWSRRYLMGLWGVLWEIFKVVVPHTAPHVARAVKDRRAADQAERRAQAVAHEMAEGFATLEERVAAAESQSAAAEERAVAAEEKLSLVQSQIAVQWATARKWILALLVWNAVITAILIYVLVARR